MFRWNLPNYRDQDPLEDNHASIDITPGFASSFV